VLAGIPGSSDLAFETTITEATGDDDAVEVGEALGHQQTLHLLGLDPVDLHLGAVVEPGVLEALDHGQVGVLVVDVLADETDLHRFGGGLHHGDHVAPRGEVDGCIEAQALAHHRVEALVVQDERQLVDVAGVGGVDHRVVVDVAQAGDLALQVVAERRLAAAHDDVGLDATAAQLGDGVLRGLRLLLARGADEGHQRDVDVADVVATDVGTELTQRFQERQDLDVADRAAHLGDDHIDVVGGQAPDAALDLVGDVRDDLHGLAQVVASALRREHCLVDAAGGGVGVARQRLVDEPLVVAQVEVGLAAVVGDEHLTVLERVHRAGVDVDVRVELLHGDPQATHLQQTTQR